MSKTEKELQEEAERIRNMPDEDIDTSDIPERTDFSNFEVGKFYRPRKKSITIRVDMDILDWFKAKHNKYQSTINQVLRDYIKQQYK